MLETHWTGKVDSVAFSLFGKDVAWYGIIITMSMLFGLMLAIRLAKRIHLKSDDLLELFLIAIPLAVLGGRLGFVFGNFKDFFLVDAFGWSDFVKIFAVWDGGITIMTAAPCGILGGLLWAKWRKVDFLTLTDTLICVVILCQAFGRWGNFFNQEIYGQPVTDLSLQWFPYAIFITRGTYGWYQATFFYEFIANILAFFAMHYLSRRLRIKGSGLLLYGFFYGMIRFILEFYRNTGFYDDLSVNGNQVLSIIVSLLCLSALVTIAVIKHKKYRALKADPETTRETLAAAQVFFPHKIPARLYANAKKTTGQATDEKETGGN